MQTFPAYLVTKTDEGQQLELKQLTTHDLMAGDVTLKVEYSSLNYKDGLAITGKGPVIRKYPLIPGIDLAGTVVDSEHESFSSGDQVLLTGYGVGEVHHGGYAGLARVKGDWLVPLPPGMTTRQAMAIGTAGYTAMLCVMAIEKHGITPETGKLLVTGASGGVGSLALTLLSRLGYRVTAVTGRMEEKDYLAQLGASDVIERSLFAGEVPPLGKSQWSGAVDVAGGKTLANVLSQMSYGGAVAACGLADAMDLPTSVAPFILRGVTLYGIDSVMTPQPERQQAWQRLARDLDMELLEKMIEEIDFEQIPDAAEAILAGKIRGRALVKIPN